MVEWFYESRCIVSNKALEYFCYQTPHIHCFLWVLYFSSNKHTFATQKAKTTKLSPCVIFLQNILVASSSVIQSVTGPCFSCRIIERSRETSFTFLAVAGLKSHSLATLNINISCMFFLHYLTFPTQCPVLPAPFPQRRVSPRYSWTLYLLPVISLVIFHFVHTSLLIPYKSIKKIF